MAQPPHRKTGHLKRRSREARRLRRDRKIFAKLRLSVVEAERLHDQFAEPVEPLSVFYGKETIPDTVTLSPFPMVKQDNERAMPQWADLSQWMKVTMATMVCHEWDLLTFNINLDPGLEMDLVAQGNVRTKLSERVRKHLAPQFGAGREYFFLIEGHSTGTRLPTHLHLHGAIATRDGEDDEAIKMALAKAAGHKLVGGKLPPRVAHAKWFERLRVAYPNYLFKFTLRRDPRLDERRLVMSRAMTQAASMFWSDIAHQRPWV